MSIHYVAMAGLHGCIPNYVACHEDRDAAVQDLVDLHEMNAVQHRELGGTGIVDLEPEQGNAYAEVVECECAHPEEHEG